MNAFYRFMSRRYGADLLSWFLLALSFILLLIVSLFDVWFLCLLPLLLVAWVIFRTFSSNVQARRLENAAFANIGATMKLAKNKFRDRKTHIYFRCARCNTVLRIPRGKGTVRVTCPRCKSTSEQDTGSSGIQR